MAVILWLKQRILLIWEQQIYWDDWAYKGYGFNFMFGMPVNMKQIWGSSMQQYYSWCVQCYKEIVGNLLDADARTQHLANLLHFLIDKEWRTVSNFERVRQLQWNRWVDYVLDSNFVLVIPLRELAVELRKAVT